MDGSTPGELGVGGNAEGSAGAGGPVPSRRPALPRSSPPPRPRRPDGTDWAPDRTAGAPAATDRGRRAHRNARARPSSRVAGSTWPAPGSRPRRASSSAGPRSSNASARSTQAEARASTVTPQVAAAGYSCSSPLRLFEHSNYGGRQLLFFDRGYWQNLPDYGFNDQLSSYIIGACYLLPGRAQRRGRALHPGPTWPVGRRPLDGSGLERPGVVHLHGLGPLRPRLPQQPRPCGKREAAGFQAGRFRVRRPGTVASRKLSRMDEDGPDAGSARSTRRTTAPSPPTPAAGRPDGDLAQDAVSETFLVAWRRLADVPTGADTLPWLYGVARRVLANQRRGNQRRADLSVPPGPGVAARTRTSTPGSSSTTSGGRSCRPWPGCGRATRRSSG